MRYLAINICILLALLCGLAHADSSGTSINAGTCVSQEKLAQLQAAATHDDLYAVRDLDVYYSSCVGDRDKAMTYAKQKALIGTAEDVSSYATALESREGPKAAFPWYLKAAQMGESGAKLYVARAYRDGEVVKADPVQALMWFELGATCQEFGMTDMQELAEFLWKNKPVPLAGPKALAWLTVVSNRTDGLIPYYKSMQTDIQKNLSETELEISTQLAGEYRFTSGCSSGDK